jgi:hypothetical protein
MGGLTAYVQKFSILPLRIEDDHPFVSWGVGVSANIFLTY